MKYKVNGKTYDTATASKIAEAARRDGEDFTSILYTPEFMAAYQSALSKKPVPMECALDGGQFQAAVVLQTRFEP
jgi:hypothetical protein